MKTTFKRLFLAAILALSLQSSAFAQSDGYAFLCDLNGFGLSGFYLYASNIVGVIPTSALPTNLVSIATLNNASNVLAVAQTNATWATSNYFLTRFGMIDGSANIETGASNSFPFLSTNNVLLGGNSNFVGFSSSCVSLGGDSNSVWVSANSFNLGGRYNFCQGLNSGNLGGAHSYNYQFTVSPTPDDPGQFIMGGLYNTINASAPGNMIFGGQTNYINQGAYQIILGGRWNTMGNGGFNTCLNGMSNLVTAASSWSIVGGQGALAQNNNVFVWSDNQGQTNRFGSTGDNQFLIRAAGGVGINTNNPGGNALRVNGWIDLPGTNSGITMNGTNITTLFSTTALSALFNYLLSSNVTYLTAQIIINSNITLVSSNALSTRIIAVSNAVVAVSNAVITVYAGKAFSTYLPANYSSIGVAFSTPLMPDANYSVSLTPQDSSTAGALLSGMTWWVDSKSTSGFLVHVPFATNAFNLNFDCTVKENTQ